MGRRGVRLAGSARSVRSLRSGSDGNPICGRRTAEHYARALDRHLYPRIGDRRIGSIDEDTIAAADRGPARAGPVGLDDPRHPGAARPCPRLCRAAQADPRQPDAPPRPKRAAPRHATGHADPHPGRNRRAAAGGPARIQGDSRDGDLHRPAPRGAPRASLGRTGLRQRRCPGAPPTRPVRQPHRAKNTKSHSHRDHDPVPGDAARNATRNTAHGRHQPIRSSQPRPASLCTTATSHGADSAPRSRQPA